MTWGGEGFSDTSGIMVFTEDGTPNSITGLPGQVIVWQSGGSPPPRFVNMDEALEGSTFVNNIVASGAPAAVFAVDATGVATTTSLAYVDIPDMVITPPSGTYLCIFNASISPDKGNQTVDYGIFVDGVLSASSERFQSVVNAGQKTTISSAGIAVGVSGINEITVKWRRGPGTGGATTWSIFGRTLACIQAINNF